MKKLLRLLTVFLLIGVGLKFSGTAAFGSTQLNATGPTISTGGTNTCVVGTTGKVKCWGSNEWGQSNPPAELQQATQVSASYLGACAIDIAGKVFCWGYSYSGANPDKLPTNVPTNLGVIKRIQTGQAGNACAIDLQGKLSCWGDNSEGISAIPNDLGPVIDVSLGSQNTCAVKYTGQLKCWGAFDYGINTTPQLGGKAVQVTVGQFHACVLLEDGRVNCWGLQGSYGNLDVPQDLGFVTKIYSNTYNTCALNVEQIVKCWGLDNIMKSNLGSIGKVQQFTLGAEYDACALQVEGTLVCFGDNTYGQNFIPTNLPSFVSISNLPWRTCAIDQESNAHCWGYNYGGIGTSPSNLGKVSQIVGSYYSTCTLAINGEVTCWGTKGQGDPGPAPRNLGSVAQLTAGAYHMCALNNLGQITCWGKKNYGYNTWDYLPPVTQATAIQISSGEDFTCALYSDGSVKCWGDPGLYGATAVPALKDIKQISTGLYHVCALQLSGQVTCWGMGTILNVPSDLTDVKSLSSGLAFTCALKIDNSVRCWDAYASSEWAPPRDLSEVRSLSNGHGSAMCAILTTGESKCWGQGQNFGQDFGQANIPSAVGDILGQNYKIRDLPTIQGKPIVGEQLTVLPGEWPSDANLTYAWLQDGNVINGAVSNSYQVVDADFNHSITVRITGTVSGYSPTDSTSLPVVISSRYFPRSPGTPSIDSSDGVLYASARTQISGTTQTFKWYKDGTLIDDQNSDSYVLKTNEQNHTFVVEVTYSQPGFISITSRSQPFVPANLPPAPVISKILPIDRNGNIRILFDPVANEGYPNFPTNYAWSIDGGATWTGESDGVMPSLPKPNRYLDAHIGIPNKSISLLVRSMTSGGWGVASAPFEASTSVNIKLSLPQILGSPQVGNTLQVSVTGLDPSDTSLSFRWMRDSVPIENANSSTYKLGVSDYQHSVSVEVTGIKNAYSPATVVSEPVKVSLGVLQSVEAPILSGVGNPGNTLAVSSLSSDLKVSYLWIRDGRSTGVTGDTYVSALSDAGSTISVFATYSKDGYNDYSVSSNTLEISTNVRNTACAAELDRSNWELTSSSMPAITGAGTFGSTLVGLPGSWVSGTKFCTYWYENGQAIPGALTATYRIQPADIGKQIRYAVVGTDKSGKSVLRFSPPITISKASFPAPQLPSLFGVPKVGRKLTGAIVKPWALGATYTYQWLKNNISIDGATSPNYKVTPQDVDSTIGLTVCGSKQNYDSICLTSQFPSQVDKGNIKPPPAVTIQGSSAKPGAVLTGVAGNWPQGVSISLIWMRDGVTINGQTNANYTITQADRGHSITFQVTGTAIGYTDCVKVSAAKKIP